MLYWLAGAKSTCGIMFSTGIFGKRVYGWYCTLFYWTYSPNYDWVTRLLLFIDFTVVVDFSGIFSFSGCSSFYSSTFWTSIWFDSWDVQLFSSNCSSTLWLRADLYVTWYPMPGRLTPSENGSRCSNTTVLPAEPYKFCIESSWSSFGTGLRISFWVLAQETLNIANSFL